MSNRISDEELLAELRRVAETLDERPTVAQFNEHGAYSDSTLRTRFGSWSAALEAAGLDTTGAKRPVPKSELIAELKELAAELGQPPTVQQMNAEGPRWHSVYQERFGSWNNALRAAGLEPHQHRSATDTDADTNVDGDENGDEDANADADADANADADGNEKGDLAVEGAVDEAESESDATVEREANTATESTDGETSRSRIPTETLLADIRRVAVEYDADANADAGVNGDTDGGDAGTTETETDAGGRAGDELEAPTLSVEAPTLSEYREAGAYGAQTLYDRFGSWNDAVEAAGFRSREPEGLIPETALCAELQRLADGETPPTAAEMRDDGKYWPSTYRNRFDSWEAALEAAGFEPRSDDPTRETLCEALEALADELGTRPSKAEMAADGAYDPHEYRSVFGSWTAALKAAGFEPPTSGQAISEAALLEALRELADELDTQPSAREMDAQGRYSSATYQRRFGSWTAALEAALDADGA